MFLAYLVENAVYLAENVVYLADNVVNLAGNCRIWQEIWCCVHACVRAKFLQGDLYFAPFSCGTNLKAVKKI